MDCYVRRRRIVRHIAFWSGVVHGSTLWCVYIESILFSYFIYKKYIERDYSTDRTIQKHIVSFTFLVGWAPNCHVVEISSSGKEMGNNWNTGCFKHIYRTIQLYFERFEGINWRGYSRTEKAKQNCYVKTRGL